MCVCACVHVFVHYISCLKLQYAAIFFKITQTVMKCGFCEFKIPTNFLCIEQLFKSKFC